MKTTDMRIIIGRRLAERLKMNTDTMTDNDFMNVYDLKYEEQSKAELEGFKKMETKGVIVKRLKNDKVIISFT